MSVLTTLTKKLEEYTALPTTPSTANTSGTATPTSNTNTSTNTNTTTATLENTKNETLTENAYGLLDLFVYYMMNIVLFMILFVDLVVEFVNNCVHKYNIVSCSFKHKLYNNIN